MLYSKTITLLSALPKQQIKQLKAWVASPCFNTDEKVLSLFQYLAKHHGNYNEANVNVAVVLKNVKGIKSINKLNQKASALLNIIEIFLHHQNPNNTISCSLELLKTYKHWVLEKHFIQQYNKLQKKLSENKFKEPDDYYHEHTLIETAYQGFTANTQHDKAFTISPILHSLDIFYYSKKLRYLCEVANRKKFTGIADEIENTDDFFKSLQPYNNNQYPYIYCFSKVYTLISSPINAHSLQDYKLLKDFLQQYKSHIHPLDYKAIIGYAQNFCLRCINENITAFEKEYLYFNELRVAENLLLEQKLVEPHYFRNIVSIAIKINELAYAKNFVAEYKASLPATHQEAYTLYCEAMIAYAEKKYDKAEQIITTTPNGDTKVFDALLKKMLLKIKLDNPTSPKTTLKETLKNYLKFLDYNEAKLASHYLPLKNFGSYYDNLINSRSRQQEDIAHRINNLKEEKAIADKDWLLKKLSESLQLSESMQAV